MKNYLLKAVAVLYLMVITHAAFAQYNPFATGPYAGVTGLYAQPASMADSRYKVDVTVMGLHSGIASNFAGNLWSLDVNDFTYDLQGKNNMSSYIQAELLNVMVSLTPRQSFGFGFRTRGIGNIGDAPRELMQGLYQRNDIANGTSFAMNGFFSQYNTFSELFASYAMMVTPRDAVHAVSVGATLKLNSGGNSVYMKYTGGEAVYNNGMLTMGADVTGEIGRSENDNRYFDFGMSNKMGFGIDVGVTYEYRPDIAKHKYDMDGERGLVKPYPNKYLLKASVALFDLGTAVNYKGGGYAFRGNGSAVSLDGITLTNLFDRVTDGVNPDDVPFSEYSMSLPMVLNAAVDWNVGKGVYLNANAVVGFSQDAKKAFYRNTYTLTPRFERLWFGIGLPLQYDQYSNFNAGLMLRLGPLWIGSQTLFTNLASKNSKATDISVIVKIPFTKNMKKDVDGDGVSDQYDLCPKARGPWATKGCPDSDGDGIPDDVDLCPYEAGPAATGGCPDSDGDGIIDVEDACPYEAGQREYKGCPDTDGDGIVDKNDECPLEPGPAATNGCPDRDGDGVADKYDRCLDTPGPIWNFGCPEGYQGAKEEVIVVKQEEPKKEEVVLVEPEVIDTKKYEAIALTKEQKDVVDNAFNDIEFDTGKATIRAGSHKSMDDLAELLKKNPSWRVTIVGHTDNVGSSSFNKLLSQNRANAGRNYLIKRGVAPERVDTYGMGDTKPVASNKTEEGRQKNRRMVVTIVKNKK